MGNHPNLLPSPPLASFIGTKTAVHAPLSTENYIMRPLSHPHVRERSHGIPSPHQHSDNYTTRYTLNNNQSSAPQLQLASSTHYLASHNLYHPVTIL